MRAPSVASRSERVCIQSRNTRSSGGASMQSVLGMLLTLSDGPGIAASVANTGRMARRVESQPQGS